MRTLVSLLLVASAAFADDWPHWRGPQRNGISAETGWLDAYHARVLETLSPLLDSETRLWLAAATRPLAR